MTTATIRGCREFGTDKYLDKRDRVLGRPSQTGMIVVEDKLPIEKGGFRPGARIDALQVKFMLEQRTIALGSTLRSKTRLYRVALDMKGRLVLSRVSENFENVS